jgi:hypothetical protein
LSTYSCIQQTTSLLHNSSLLSWSAALPIPVAGVVGSFLSVTLNMMHIQPGVGALRQQVGVIGAAQSFSCMQGRSPFVVAVMMCVIINQACMMHTQQALHTNFNPPHHTFVLSLPMHSLEHAALPRGCLSPEDSCP